jgi:hypothetical protein
MKPEKPFNAQSRCSVAACRCAFFPPGLDPVLDRGEGDEHAMITPETPTGCAVWQAILDDQADGGVDDAARVVAAAVGQVGHVGVEVLAALRAVVPGMDHDEVAGPVGAGVAEVMEGAAAEAIAVGAVTAARAGAAAVVAAAGADDGLGQVLDAGDALGGVGSVLAQGLRIFNFACCKYFGQVVIIPATP